MSDYDYGSGDEGWPSDQEDEDMGDVEIQNNYHEAEDNKRNNPEEALEQFETVVIMEESSGEVEWSFKALQNIVLLSAQLRKFDNMTVKYKRLLTLINKVARNDVTDAINNILEAVAKIEEGNIQKEMYELTLVVLKESNERLWFTTSNKLGEIYLENKDVKSLEEMLVNLKEYCHNKEEDINKENLLKVYALEIQMCSLTKDNKRLKRIYPETMNLNSVINDPRVMGIIKENGGKMFLEEKNWQAALEDLFESFKNYQESGNSRAVTVLKYVVLASILSNSTINYLDTREAKVYKDIPEIVAITRLRESYEKNNINDVNAILNDKSVRLLDDPYIAQHLNDLLRNIRLSVLVQKIKPYRSVSLKFLAEELKVTEIDVKSLLVELILEQKIKGKIDQLQGFLEISEKQTWRRHGGMQKWAKTLMNIQQSLIDKVKN